MFPFLLRASINASATQGFGDVDERGLQFARSFRGSNQVDGSLPTFPKFANDGPRTNCLRRIRHSPQLQRLAQRLAEPNPSPALRCDCATCLRNLEAPPGFEPGIEVLQTSALPLGDGAGRNWMQGDSGRV